MAKRGRPAGSTNKSKQLAPPSIPPPQIPDVAMDDIISMPIETLRDEITKFVEVITERLTRVEEWQRRTIHEISHVKDMDTIVADMSVAMEGLRKWKDETQTLIRSGFGEKSHVVEHVVQPAKNQELAKLEGQFATLQEKVNANSDNILTIQRKYLLPQSYKEPSVQTIVTDSISSLERKLDNH